MCFFGACWWRTWVSLMISFLLKFCCSCHTLTLVMMERRNPWSRAAQINSVWKGSTSSYQLHRSGILFQESDFLVTRFSDSWDTARWGSLIATTTKPTEIDFGQIGKALAYEFNPEHLSLNFLQNALGAKNISSCDSGTINV